MKRLLVFAVLLIASPHLFAQSFDEGIRYWKDGPLTWDDLRLKQTRDTTLSELSIAWQFDTDTLRPAWNTVQYRLRPETVLIKTASWHDKDHCTSFALGYDQLLFDLGEIYFRKMLTEYELPGNKHSYDSLLDYYNGMLADHSSRIKEETRNGKDSAMVFHHRAMLDEELDNSTFPDIGSPKTKNGTTLSLGAVANVISGRGAATFSPSYGMALGAGFWYDRHIVDLFVHRATGHLLSDFDHNGLIWKAGEAYSHDNIALTYQYLVYDGYTISLAPLAGVGMRGLS